MSNVGTSNYLKKKYSFCCGPKKQALLSATLWINYSYFRYIIEISKMKVSGGGQMSVI